MNTTSFDLDTTTREFAVRGLAASVRRADIIGHSATVTIWADESGLMDDAAIQAAGQPFVASAVEGLKAEGYLVRDVAVMWVAIKNPNYVPPVAWDENDCE